MQAVVDHFNIYLDKFKELGASMIFVNRSELESIKQGS